MPNLSDLLDLNLLGDMIGDGFVNLHHHPCSSLAILNYTDKATYDNEWNGVTKICRGIVYDIDTMEVLARPFPKFWNAVEHMVKPGLDPIPWHERWRIFDKADGSLGIVVSSSDGVVIATRGSFTSDQARHATKMWRKKYGEVVLVPGYTVLVEIVYPSNRVVIDYEGLDDLILLGMVDIATGQSLGPRESAETLKWPGPVCEEYPVRSFNELMSDDRPNREGYVLWFPESEFRVKVKHETYMRLHALVTRANTRTVWEALRDGVDLLDLGLPDEFGDWLKLTENALRMEYAATEEKGHAAFDAVKELPNRKDQALWLLANAGKTAVSVAFALLDGKPHEQIIWKVIRPETAESFWYGSEDVA